MNHISETHAASSHTFTPTRQVWIDLVKGVAICLVVMGHFPWSGSGQIIKNAIYSFHMPLFFIMAGCTAAISASRSFSVSNFLFKRFVSVFIPYTCWCFLMGIPFSNIADLFQTYSFNDHLHTFICGDVMQWFLICLFVLHIMYAMYKFVTNKFSSVWVRLMTAGCLFVFIFFLHRLWGRTSADAPYWSLDFLTNAYQFFVPFAVGVFMMEHPNMFRKMINNGFVALFMVFSFIFCMASTKDAPSYYSIWLIGVSISLMIIKLAQNVNYDIIANRALKIFINQSVFIGKYTLAIYLLHQYFIPSQPLFNNDAVGGTLSCLVTLVLALVVCYVCVALEHIISLSPFWNLVLLGKRKASA